MPDETMSRPRTAEEIQRLKARGVIDVGTTYLPIVGFDKEPKHKFWDGYKPKEK